MTPPSSPSRLAVVCLGHPLEPRTWSGTPANVCAELRRRGRLGAAIDSEAYAPRPFVVATKILSKLYYQGSRYVRLGRVERPLRARHVAHCLRREDSAADVLHVNVHALPVRASDEQGRGRRFLLTDTTWELWRQHATDIGRVLPRLVRDAEELERRSLAQMDHIFVIGAYVRENLVAHYGIPAERITVVGTGRGAIAPYHGEKDYAAGNILFVAKERFRDKGGDALLEGFRLARRTNPELKLFLVGQEEYKTLADAKENVFAAGRLPLAELQGLFDRAGLFVMPAANEPWGLVYLEALSCRVPVVGLRRLALPELTQNGRFGFLLETGQPEEIAETILRAFRAPDQLAAMGLEGQRHVLEHFTWERTVERMLATIFPAGG